MFKENDFENQHRLLIREFTKELVLFVVFFCRDLSRYSLKIYKNVKMSIIVVLYVVITVSCLRPYRIV